MTDEERKAQSIEWHWHYPDANIQMMTCTKGHTVSFVHRTETEKCHWLLRWPDLLGQTKKFEDPRPAMNYAMEHPYGPVD